MGPNGRFFAYVVAVVLSSFATKELWDWYAVPTLHVEEIGFIQALGLSLLCSLLCGRTTLGSPDQSEDVKDYSAMVAVVAPILFLIIGWILHFFA